jgi:hypothetical protein
MSSTRGRGGARIAEPTIVIATAVRGQTVGRRGDCIRCQRTATRPGGAATARDTQSPGNRRRRGCCGPSHHPSTHRGPGGGSEGRNCVGLVRGTVNRVERTYVGAADVARALSTLVSDAPTPTVIMWVAHHRQIGSCWSGVDLKIGIYPTSSGQPGLHDADPASGGHPTSVTGRRTMDVIIRQEHGQFRHGDDRHLGAGPRTPRVKHAVIPIMSPIEGL